MSWLKIFLAVFLDCGAYSLVLPKLMFNITLPCGTCVPIIWLSTLLTDNSCSISFSWKGAPAIPYLESLLFQKNLHLDYYLSISLPKSPHYVVPFLQLLLFDALYQHSVSLAFDIDCHYLILWLHVVFPSKATEMNPCKPLTHQY